MVSTLARCPYCSGCEITLNDSFEVLFNPDAQDQGPCEHLIWANGGCSQREETGQGRFRVIGSTAIDWRHTGLGTIGSSDSLVPYLEMLVEAGPGWEFAPSEPFRCQAISDEGMGFDPQGKEYPAWEADGWAVFARRPSAFLAAIVACRAKQTGVWKEVAGQQAEVSLPVDPDQENDGYFGNQRDRYALNLEQVKSEDRWRDDGGRG